MRVAGIEMVRKRIEIEQALAGMAVLTITTIQHNGALACLIQLRGQLRGYIRAAMGLSPSIISYGNGQVRASQTG